MAMIRAAFPIVAVKTARPPAALGTAGFTIIEIMITLTVLGILVAAAMPSLGNLVRDQRVKTATSDIFASLIFARSEALKRNQLVVLCPSADGAACAGGWAQGWIVFVDADADGAVDAAADILRKNGAIDSSVSITASAANATYMRDGRLNAAVNFTLSSAGATSRCVRLDPSGRPNVKIGC